MTEPSNRPCATPRTQVELFLPGGKKFTLTLRGRGFEILKLSPAAS
ncbi:hypothetical protein BH11ACT6_BH11ACT6_29620 [soil metagenome]